MHVRTTFISNNSGRGQVVAKAQGKQRTVTRNPALSNEANAAAAVGALLAVLLDDKQKAKILHPSGGQRVRVLPTSDFGGKHLWSIDV